MKRICELCFKEVNKKDRYFKVGYFEDGKLKANKFLHKKCQDDSVNSKMALNKDAEKIMKGAKQLLSKMVLKDLMR